MTMNQELSRKILTLASELCWRHASNVSDSSCDDWHGDTNLDELFTPDEWNALLYQYELYNSNGEDYEPDDGKEDEVVISSVIARALEVMAEESSK